MIKWGFFMWPINSCDLIGVSVCVLDTMIFERYAGSDKNKHDIFLCVSAGLGSRERFLLSQK